MFKRQRIRDPLHNLIEFQENEFENALWSVLQTRAFQRLRRVKQLGFSELVYPGATHSRFVHSIGVFHIARMLMAVVKEHLGSSRYRASNAETALAAALVHDLGHGPFSHAFETVGRRLKLRMANHVSISDSLIREGEVAGALSVLGSGFANDVATMLTAERPTIYGAVVSSQFDADRLDYMQRDRMMSGTRLGGLDFKWLITNLEVAEIPFGVDAEEIGKVETFVVGPKATRAVESYVLGLFQLYPTVYYHKTTRGAEKLMTELLCRLVTLVREDSSTKTGLTSNNDLVRFAKNPDSIDCILALDDTVVWGSLCQMARARDPLIRDFARRLRDRDLFKPIDVREALIERLGIADREAIDTSCAKIARRIKDWRSKNDRGVPRILTDEEERAPYKKLQDSKGPANQIMLKPHSSGAVVDIAERSEVLRGLQPFKLFRVYCDKDDGDAQEFIESLIREEAAYGAH